MHPKTSFLPRWPQLAVGGAVFPRASGRGYSLARWKARFLLPATTCFLLSSCIPQLLRVTPPVRGQVTDARTHRPVSGARVGFTEVHTTGTVTDAQGRFSLPERQRLIIVVLFPTDTVPEPGPLEVRAEHYQLFRTRVRYYSADEPQSLNITLQPTP